MMSAGGAGGGLFVGLIAPVAFPAYWELHIGIVACLLITLLVLFRDRTSYLYRGQHRPAWLMIGLWVSLVAWSLRCHARDGVQAAIEVSRNFYGVLQIRDETDGDAATHRRGMFHGSILHGTQFLAEDKRNIPTTYYGVNSGVGLVMQHHLIGQQRRIGVVGLGVGTLAAYGQKQDELRFYEINSEVIRLANQYFTFLKDTESRTEMILGDARLSLEHEVPQHYDILVVDAFSGDAIPTHLLTREAAMLYKQHLSDNGILCIHISNLHFDLRPVVLGLAKDVGLESTCVVSGIDKSQGTQFCRWMLLSRQPIPQAIVDRAEGLEKRDQAGILWTDEWSNLLSVLQ